GMLLVAWKEGRSPAGRPAELDTRVPGAEDRPAHEGGEGTEMDLQCRTGRSGPAGVLAKTIGVVAALGLAVLVPLSASAQPASRGTLVRLTQVSHDGCASPLSYHASQVEPMIASHGTTIVATFQVGRVYDGGSCDIGWATSTDGGLTWQTGLLPLTIFGGQATTGAGPLTRASDPSVAY